MYMWINEIAVSHRPRRAASAACRARATPSRRVRRSERGEGRGAAARAEKSSRAKKGGGAILVARASICGEVPFSIVLTSRCKYRQISAVGVNTDK